jgi:hypothetical protein
MTSMDCAGHVDNYINDFFGRGGRCIENISLVNLNYRLL